MATMVVGDPWDERTDLGPLIRRDHLERVEAYLERAYAAGGDAGRRGRSGRDEQGVLHQPGPGRRSRQRLRALLRRSCSRRSVLIVPFDTVDEAVALANETRFGLNANVWGPTDEAMRVARRIRSGTVTLNGGGGERPDAPWGGYGESGVRLRPRRGRVRGVLPGQARAVAARRRRESRRDEVDGS